MNPKKAFTLVELLVAMAIISVILGLALFGIAAAQRNARDTARRNLAKDIQVAFEDTYSAMQRHPNCITLKSDRVLIKVAPVICNANNCDTPISASIYCTEVMTPGHLDHNTAGGNPTNMTNGGVTSQGATTTASTHQCIKIDSTGYVIKLTLENGSDHIIGTSTSNTCP